MSRPQVVITRRRQPFRRMTVSVVHKVDGLPSDELSVSVDAGVFLEAEQTCLATIVYKSVYKREGRCLMKQELHGSREPVAICRDRHACGRMVAPFVCRQHCELLARRVTFAAVVGKSVH
jgi:hypothetical protein